MCPRKWVAMGTMSTDLESHIPGQLHPTHILALGLAAQPSLTTSTLGILVSFLCPETSFCFSPRVSKVRLIPSCIP